MPITPEKLNWKLTELNDAINEGLRRGLIILSGGFQTGKTTLIRQLLATRGLSEEHYLSVNQYLLKELNQYLQKNPDLSHKVLSVLKTKTASLFKNSMETFLDNFFKSHHLLILDSIELLFNYPINLPQIAYHYCNERNSIIISMPEDIKKTFLFDWNLSLAKVITLD
jgi:archaellum biogenesis ATPase FlaH